MPGFLTDDLHSIYGGDRPPPSEDETEISVASRVVVFPGLSGLTTEIEPLLHALRQQAITQIVYPDWASIRHNGIAEPAFLSYCRDQIGSTDDTAFFGSSFGGLVALAIAADLLRKHLFAPVIGLLDTPSSPDFHAPKPAPLINRVIRARRNGVVGDKLWGRFVKAIFRLPLPRPVVAAAARRPRDSRLGHALQCIYTWPILEELQEWMATIHTPLPLEAVLFRCVKQEADVPYDLGWRALIRHVRIIDIPGDHLGITQASYAPILATHVEESGWLKPAATGLVKPSCHSPTR
jgi:thioesterase domain-containing protein